MFGLAHRAVLLAPAEDAFGHFAAGLRDLVADVAGRARPEQIDVEQFKRLKVSTKGFAWLI